MQIAAKSSLILTESSSLEMLNGLPKASRQGEFYQQITKAIIKGVRTKEALTSLGEQLTTFAHYAYASRQMGVVEQVSQILMNMPLGSEIRNIARYYQAFCIKRTGQFSEARRLFERVADEGSLKYRARAMIALGSIAFDSGDFQSVLPFYKEANRAARHNWEFDPLSAFYTNQMVAIINGISGNHRGSVADLERMLPLARAVGLSYPPLYYIHLNSLAVEMIEVGRLEEARNLSNIVLATPYANAYSEWRETGADLAVRGYRTPRYLVSLNHKVFNIKRVAKPDNLLHLPVRESEGNTGSEKYHRNPFQPQSDVTKIKDWKAKMVKEPNGNKNDDITPKDLDSMSEQDMIVKIFRLSSQEGLTREQLREILENVLKVTKAEK